MATPRKRQYGPSDISDAARLYDETKDPMYLALAVGALPHKPPLWVIEECAKLVEDVARKAGHGHDRDKMGQRLDEMWRFFYLAPSNYILKPGVSIDPDGTPYKDATPYKDGLSKNKAPSLAAAARHAISVVDQLEPSGRTDQFSAAMVNLQRAWRTEALEVAPSFEDHELFDGLVSTPRMVRIMLEVHDEVAGFPFRHVSLHIARRERTET